MKRFVRTTNGKIFDTTNIKYADWDNKQNKKYFIYDKYLILIYEEINSYPITKAELCGFVQNQADTIKELVTDDDVIRNNILYTKNPLNNHYEPMGTINYDL